MNRAKKYFHFPKTFSKFHCKACFKVTLFLFITPFSSQVAQSLCNFQRLWKEGRISDIEREITTAPTPKLIHTTFKWKRSRKWHGWWRGWWKRGWWPGSSCVEVSCKTNPQKIIGLHGNVNYTSMQICKTRTCVRTCDGWPNGFASRLASRKKP